MKRITFEVGDGDVVAGLGMSLIRRSLQPNMSLVFVFFNAFALNFGWNPSARSITRLLRNKRLIDKLM